ncbi:SH3 domain-containing protein [Herbivorax sp. ANBcel31]|uniref:SH3 domain-containing protein n=1 Tax=Herbivorax sp. ANBcel31 TaxID=3069754 RepID=UPI0027B6E6EA|nr:SH3 domain-containing protein [Herbivorax sp. ANBcel31]MDQ2085563.1 SH3 domain-containing protein [Herbivorax sp. ANBcel31]
MLKKRFVSIIALTLVLVMSFAGCTQEVFSPKEEQPTHQPVETPEEVDEGTKENENQEEAGEGTKEGKNQEEVDENKKTDEKIPHQSSESAKGKNVYISTNKLNVRVDSNSQSKVLGSLVKGKEVKVIEEVESEETTWYKIQFKNSVNNNEGWILSEYTVKDINELLSSPTLFEDKEMNDYFTSPTLFEDNTVVAYYGHPYSDVMGIVGRHSKEELISLLKKTAEKYDSVNGNKGVIPAIYLIYGTVQPEGEINMMNFDLVISYIEEAYKNGVLIYLDNQIGKYSPIDAINELLPFLKYPNVHLALDPEWRTDKPMKKIGHLTAAELNEVQETMREYIISNEIKGKRQFVFHQFIDSMIRDIDEVSSNYDPVLLVHNTSGWGSPEGKRAIHIRNSKVTNIPYKGFKLWYFYSDKPGVHFDDPLMTPEQVLELDPKPGLIIYQ